MELTEFAKLIACDSTNTAKNTLSYLIGNGQYNANWNKALASLYKSFPAEIKETKEQKKEFFPVLLKYFHLYELSNDNIDIFNEYIDFFSAADKGKIKEKNPNWVWDSEPEVIFKNTLAFARAIPNRSNDIFKFIVKYQKQLDGFIENNKNKIKLIENFDKQGIWRNMINFDYSQFSDFCIKNKFDKYEILLKEIKPYTTLSHTSVIKEKNIDLFLKDIEKIGKDKLNVMIDFYPTYVKSNNNNDENVFKLLVKIVNENEFVSAVKYMNFFEEELNNYGKLLDIKSGILSNYGFKEMLEEQKKGNSSYNRDFSLELILENKNWFEFFKNYTLMNELQDNLKESNSVKTNKVKI